MNCKGSSEDPNYANHDFNAQYIAPNQEAYDLGQAQLGTGKTKNQLVTENIKNNPISTTIAGAGVMGLGVVTGGGLPTLGMMAAGGSIGMGANGVVQSFSDEPFDLNSFFMSGITGAASSGMGFGPAVLINAGGALTGSGISGNNPNDAMTGAVVGTAIGYPIGSKTEGALDKVFNPWYRQEWKDIGMGIQKFIPKNPIPSWTGNAASSIGQEISGNKTQETIAGNK